MKKIYEDYLNKFDENEINFFKDQLGIQYLERELKYKKDLENNSYIIPRMNDDLINEKFKIKRNNSQLDVFICYLDAQNLISKMDGTTYLCSNYYNFFLTKLGEDFLKFILGKEKA